jgi:hypothetical protein
MFIWSWLLNVAKGAASAAEGEAHALFDKPHAKLDDASYAEGQAAFHAGVSVRSIVEAVGASAADLDDPKIFAGLVGFADAFFTSIRPAPTPAPSPAPAAARAGKKKPGAKAARKTRKS